MRKHLIESARSSKTILILLASSLISCASVSLPGNSKEGTSSALIAEKREGIDTANYCEIIVCVGKIKDECEMRIGIMDNYDATIRQEDGGSYVLKIDKAILIEYLIDWMLQESLSLNRFKSGDKLLYRKYKEASADYYARFHNSLLRVTRKIRLDEQAPGYKFTFGQIVQAAESLRHTNRTQLGTETLLVKRRTFQKAPSDSFFISSIKHADLY
jgi:hypothetical protein